MCELRDSAQVEVLGEGVEQELGFTVTEVEERDFALIITNHAIHVFVGEVIAEAVNAVGVAGRDTYCHTVLKKFVRLKIRKIIEKTKFFLGPLTLN